MACSTCSANSTSFLQQQCRITRPQSTRPTSHAFDISPSHSKPTTVSTALPTLHIHSQAQTRSLSPIRFPNLAHPFKSPSPRPLSFSPSSLFHDVRHVLKLKTFAVQTLKNKLRTLFKILLNGKLSTLQELELVLFVRDPQTVTSLSGTDLS